MLLPFVVSVVFPFLVGNVSVVFIIIYFNSMGTTISPCSEGVLISGVRSKATAEREMIMCPVQPCAFTLGPDASDTPRFIQL